MNFVKLLEITISAFVVCAPIYHVYYYVKGWGLKPRLGFVKGKTSNWVIPKKANHEQTLRLLYAIGFYFFVFLCWVYLILKVGLND